MKEIDYPSDLRVDVKPELLQVYSPSINFHIYQPVRKFVIEDEIIFDISGVSGASVGFNEKIWQESYLPMLHRGLLGNGYVGFGLFGTLRDWIKLNHPDDWKDIVDIAKAKQEGILGDPYIHPIFPLIGYEDKKLVTEIGLRAFYSDFGFIPNGFWLPESAVDNESLSVLAECGINEVLLRSDQVRHYESSSVYQVDLDNGGSILVYPYDRELSGRLAFGDISNANSYADHMVWKMQCENGNPLLVSVDGETIGHHRGVGSLDFLSYLVNHSLPQRGVNFSRQRCTAKEASIIEKSSWSCDHNLGRWTGNCGCDDANQLVRDKKKGLYSELQNQNQKVELDLLREYPGWKELYISWFLDQREFLSNGLPVSLEGIPSEFRQLFRKKLLYHVGMTSCSWFFGGEARIERQIAENSLGQMMSIR